MASHKPPASPRGTEEQPQSQPSHPEQKQQPQQQQQQSAGTPASQMQAGPRPPRFRDWASI